MIKNGLMVFFVFVFVFFKTKNVKNVFVKLLSIITYRLEPPCLKVHGMNLFPQITVQLEVYSKPYHLAYFFNQSTLLP